MLSTEEYEDIKYQLNNIPEGITGQRRKNLRQELKNKLDEHHYAIQYPPFTPLPHTTFFINHDTAEKTLFHLIGITIISNIITIDTESVCVFQQTNRPALMQVQIIPPNTISYVILVEVCHLPRETTNKFKLVQQLFDEIFNSNKRIYIWGNTDELKPFIKFNLFSSNEINLENIFNLQQQFKNYWNEHHLHRPLSSSNNYSNCLCEACLGIAPKEKWGLQKAVGYELNQWLDKRQSKSAFDIGLDPQMNYLNDEESNYRQRLTKYAADDCLAMEQIMINMNLMNNQPSSYSSAEQKIILPYQIHVSNSTSSTHKNSNSKIQMKTPQKKKKFILPKFYDGIEMISSEDEYPSEEQIANQILSTKQSSTLVNDIREINQEQLISTSTGENSNSIIISTNETQLTNQQHIRLEPEEHERERIPETETEELSAEERKRIHNRSCTRKQRRRYYANEIIIKNIDDRFSIRAIKDILKYKNVSIFAVNKFISKKTNELSLAIGIRDTTKLSSYRMELRNLFSSSHFLQFQRMKRQLRYRYRNNNRNPEHERRH